MGIGTSDGKYYDSEHEWLFDSKPIGPAQSFTPGPTGRIVGSDYDESKRPLTDDDIRGSAISTIPDEAFTYLIKNPVIKAVGETAFSLMDMPRTSRMSMPIENEHTRQSNEMGTKANPKYSEAK